jgi:hypothetical protein
MGGVNRFQRTQVNRIVHCFKSDRPSHETNCGHHHVAGLTLREAESLLDWLAANDCIALVLSYRGDEGFWVEWDA